jgi:branched-chain amino acid transport system ATP-binding protein
VTALLDVDGLDVRYGDFQALHGVSLRVEAGSALALVGANGAGKTTLLRTIAGGCPVTRGSVRYDGQDITREPPHRRIARGIALVPEGRRLFPSLTVEENILIGAAAARRRRRPPTVVDVTSTTVDRCGCHIDNGGDWSLERIYETFAVVGRRRHRASQLSGGEQQAVAIARALATGPSLLLLDEISLGLAPRVVGELYQTLTALREDGTTMVLVEQDLSRALSVCDDVVCLLEGRVSLTGPATVSRDEVVAAYFGGVRGVAPPGGQSGGFRGVVPPGGHSGGGGP